MRGRDTVLLLVAAVVGVTGGVSLALEGPASTAPSGSPSGGQSAAAPTTRTAETPAPRATGLLYATSTTVYDGALLVDHDLGETPFSLTRAADGYVLGRGSIDADLKTETLVHLDRRGRSTTLAKVVGDWDLDDTGERLIGVRRADRRIVVWDLTGREITVGDRAVSARISVVFAGDGALASELRPDIGATLVTRYDVATGRTVRTTQEMPSFAAASADGSLITGAVDQERAAFPARADCVTAGPQPGGNAWASCDWSRQRPWNGPEVSPDGTRVLAVSRERDATGPGRYGLLDARRGADDIVSVPAPDWAYEAAYAGPRSLWVTASANGRDPFADTVVDRCTPAGCREVTRLPDSEVRLGIPR